jgi:hypothetical protein
MSHPVGEPHAEAGGGTTSRAPSVGSVLPQGSTIKGMELRLLKGNYK